MHQKLEDEEGHGHLVRALLTNDATIGLLSVDNRSCLLEWQKCEYKRVGKGKGLCG